MIIARAPMRISFVGGGTDLPDFYKRCPGRVISTAIDKYVYTAVNSTPLIKKVSAKYSITERVNHPSELKNDRIRAALLDMGIHSNIEVGTFSHLPGGLGLGGSSSFAVTLVRALNALLGRKIDRREVAEAACRLEIDLLKEPIGKQDQYAAAFGGFNVIEFQPDGNVSVEPVFMDYKTRLALENQLLLFFTGISHAASTVLIEQKANIDKKFETLKQMADSVPEFKALLLKGDFEGMGKMLHEGWLRKKSLASNVSNSVIDELYGAGMQAGAWGGKILGAGNGGSIMFFAPTDRRSAVAEAVRAVAQKNNLADFEEIPVRFVQSGVEIISDSSHHNNVYRA